MGKIKLLVEKENIKFSAAHFLIFNEHEAERLHGHNYYVNAEILFDSLSEEGNYKIDFSVLKSLLKQLTETWDEFVLLPEKHSDMKIRFENESLHLNFRDRYYVFPKQEVKLLPIENTSVEGLSFLLAFNLLKAMESRNLLLGILEISVGVEESAGQSAVSTFSAEEFNSLLK